MKKTFNIKFLIISFMMIFLIIVLTIIFIFQYFFLDDFYRSDMLKNMYSVNDRLTDGIENNALDDVIENMGMSNDVCVRVIYSRRTSITGFQGMCPLRYLSNDQIQNIYIDTAQHNDERLFKNFQLRQDDVAIEDLYLLSSIVKDAGGNNVLVMVSSIIAPINATISTLRSQLLIVAVILVIAVLILGVALSKVIVKPFNLMTSEAKNLSHGKYDGEKLKLGIKEYDELNQTLIDSRNRINEADVLRKELLSNVSHDLRTPLTMIVGYGEMMKDFDEEKKNENIDVIVDEAKRLSLLVNDLLDLSKGELGRLELKKEKLAVNELLSSVYNQYSHFLETKNIKFELINEAKDKYIIGDDKRLKQVLYNFINNAINYNDKKAPTITLKASLDAEKVEIGVLDNGKGIKESDLDKIWDRYYKVDKEHKRKVVGSGIGLSLSRAILIEHNFEYGVRSKYQEYSYFYFKAPLLKENPKG